MLEQAIRKYQNRAIETAQVIEELIGLAKHMRSAHTRGETLGLTEDELVFYDALETNDSAVKVLKATEGGRQEGRVLYSYIGTTAEQMHLGCMTSRETITAS